MSEFDLKHAFSVANRTSSMSAQLVGLLHDAIEDGALDELTVKRSNLHPDIIEVIMVITRNEGEQYGDYIKRVSGNKLATIVKIADLEANLARMDFEHESLKFRYTVALTVLEKKEENAG